MTDNASPGSVGEAAGASASGPIPLVPNFKIRRVPPPTAEERQARRDAMERAIKHGAAPYRDAEGKARYVFFKEANNASVEAWKRDREAKRGYRRTQYARKAAGQLIWHPEDQIELAKRLGVIYHREGRSGEGAAERGLYDAIWRYEHIWDSFTVPRRFGRDIIETGRIAAVAEEEARKLQAEDPRAAGGFWVRDRKNNGLIYVVPNPDPAMETLSGGDRETTLIGDAAEYTGDTPEPLEKSIAEDQGAPDLPSGDVAGTIDTEDAEVEESDGLSLEPRDELAILRQLGVDVDAPTLPGSHIHDLKEATTRYIKRPSRDGLLGQIVDEFEGEWRQLQRYGIRYYMHPELREVFDSLPDAAELAEIVKSLIPGGGEAQSLLDYNEAANRFVDRVAEGDVAGAQQAAVDVATGLAGAIPVAGRAGKVPETFQQLKRAGEAAKIRKAVPSRRPLQVILEKTPGSNEARRLTQMRQRAQLVVPKEFLNQTASQAFAKTGFPPRTHLENVQRGLAAVDLVIEQALRGQPGVLVNAMHRNDVGAITFLFGKPGIPSKKYRKGGGLSHLIAKHGVEIVDDVIETIAKGTPVERVGYGSDKRLVLHYRGHEAVLSLYREEGRETWLLTGFKTGPTDINFDLSELKGPLFFKAD